VYFTTVRPIGKMPAADASKSSSSPLWVKLCTGVVWVVWTAVGSTFFNNTFVHTFQDPLAHTLIRLIGAVVYGLFWAQLTGAPVPTAATLKGLLVPSFCLMGANQFNSMALQLGGPTLPYILKSGIPAFTVAVLFVMGSRFVPGVYASLMPICFGVAIASASDVDFHVVAFSFAFISTASQVALNLSSKKVMGRIGIDSSTAFLAMCMNGVVVMLPIGMLHMSGRLPFSDGSLAPIMEDKHWDDGKKISSQLLCVGAAFSYWIEYALVFRMVALVGPIEFCIGDIVRRLGTILFGAYLFGKTLTPMNLSGVAISLLGCVWYALIDNKELPTKQKIK